MEPSHRSNKKSHIVIADFAAAINSHDLEKIAALMSDDHTFIDAHGNEMAGKETMKEGWASYFRLFPGYYIEIEQILSEGDLAMACGYAGAGQEKKPGKFRRHGRRSSETEKSDYGRCTLIQGFNSKE